VRSATTWRQASPSTLPDWRKGSSERRWGVLRKVHEKDGETTNVVAVYSTNPALTWKVMHKYLNEDADQVAFEKASGVRLTDLPVYPGGDYPERGKASSTDKFIVKVPRPFFVVWKSNPKHVPAPPEGVKDTRSATQKTTKLFVRWETSGKAAPAEPEKPQAKPTKDDINEEVVWWKRFLDKDPSLAEVTDNFHRWMKAGQTTAVMEAVKQEAFEPWKAQSGAWYDPKERKWMPPKEPDPQADEQFPF
jgi:hypothetical protein